MALWYRYVLGPSPEWPKAVVYGIAASALIAIIIVDFELLIVPDQLSASLLVIGAAYNIWLFTQGSELAVTWGIPSSVAGAGVGLGYVWGLGVLGRFAFGRDAIGHGDMKLSRGVGAVLFPSLLGFTLLFALGLTIVFPLVKSAFPKKARQTAAAEPQPEVDEGIEYQGPESLGSLLKSGIGYALLLDVFGLFNRSFYKAYFGEDPYEPPPDLETFEAESTMVPSSALIGIAAVVMMVIGRRPF